MVVPGLEDPTPNVTTRLRSAAVEDVSVQAAMQPWVAMECYQLASGRQVAQVDSLDLGPQQVVRECQMTAIQKLGVTPPDFCSISCCTAASTTRFSDICADDGSAIFFLPANTEFDIFVPPGVKTVYVSFSQKAFLRDASALNPKMWEREPQQLLVIPARQQALLNRTVDVWLQTANAASSVSETAVAEAMQALLNNVLQIATESDDSDWRVSNAERVRAFHTCRVARAFIEESFAMEVTPSIVDICRVVGVSERTLQYAFRAYINMTPLAYLRRCRLNRVRATLRNADPKLTSVTTIAMRFGFWHLGRFAADYKNLFGEAPSVTLAS